MVDEQLETSFLSENLLSEWELNDQSDELIHSIIEKLCNTNTEWLNFLKNSEEIKCLKFDMEDADYEGVLIKTMKNEKGRRFFVFEIRDALIEETPYVKALRVHP